MGSTAGINNHGAEGVEGECWHFDPNTVPPKARIEEAGDVTFIRGCGLNDNEGFRKSLYCLR